MDLRVLDEVNIGLKWASDLDLSRRRAKFDEAGARRMHDEISPA
jgi:hypothetical protein